MIRTLMATILAAPALTLCAQDQAFFQASLTPDIAIQSRDTVIKGVSLNIWGENEQHSLTLGFVNGSVNESSGFTWGLANYCDTYAGVQWAFFNHSQTRFNGWQGAFANIANELTGLQSGCVNVARQMTGLQFGLVNYTEELEGVQLGFANVVITNPWFDEFPDKLAKGFVFVNWSF